MDRSFLKWPAPSGIVFEIIPISVRDAGIFC